MTAVAEGPSVALSPTRPGVGGRIPLTAAIVCLLGLSMFLRVWQLSSVPVINGDEVWSGVQAERLVRGDPVAWRTPSGNLVNVFSLLPLAAMHTVFSSSAGLLRSVSVTSGLAAIAANWWLCRRAYDEPTAIASTLIVALLPINIATSRCAGDASQALLCTMLVTYLPLIWIRRWPASRGWLIGGGMAFAAAAIVHPTNIFTAPLIAVPVLYARRRWLVARLRGAVTSARPLALVGLVAASLLLTYLGWSLVIRFAASAPHIDQIIEWVGLYLGLLSGATTYASITGAASAGSLNGIIPQLANLLMVLVAALAFAGWFQRLGSTEDDVDICLLDGWLPVTLGFILVAGPWMLTSSFERHGICLIAPAVVVLARGLTWWIAPVRPNHGLARLALLAVAYCFVVSFALAYFRLRHVSDENTCPGVSTSQQEGLANLPDSWAFARREKNSAGQFDNR